ncbi:MAG: hypothetical protein VX768_15845 [Planctomycetota bacterium]|nr:hypothetical protein [Planctomycetota bacterium]
MHKPLFKATLIFCFSILSSLPLKAQGQNEVLDGLLKKAESVAEFAPISKAQIDEAKSNLTSALNELDRQLTRQSEANAIAWKSYLEWEALLAQSKAESAQRTELVRIARKFQMNHPGLELKVFTDVRKAIHDYANTSYFGQESIGKRIYDSRLKLVRTNLEKLKAGYDDRTIGLIGEAITDLENARQCPALVQSVRQAFSKPNLHVQISEKLAKAVARQQKTSDVRPVDEEILGVHQQGTAHTTARFDVDFLPSTTTGKFKIIIRGDTVSEQIGTKDLSLLGCIYICSEGDTALVGDAIVEYDGKHLSYGNLRAGALTKTKIVGIDAPPLLEGLIMNQVEKQKQKGEAEAAKRARSKFAQQIRSQLNDVVKKTNDRLENGIRPTTRRLDFEPRQLEVNTSDDFLRILAIVGNRQQLSGWKGPVSSSKSDVILQVHESTLNNALQHVLGGRSISNEDLRELVSSFGIELPPAPADEKPLTITFPRVRPVQVAFDGGKITTTISANRIQQGGTLVRDKLQIIVTYELKSNDKALQFARSEAVAIKFEGAYTNAKSIIESNIKPKLEELFKKETRQLSIDQLDLPEEIKKVGMPAVSLLNLEGGWLHVEMNLEEKKVASENSLDQFLKAPLSSAINNSARNMPGSESQGYRVYISDTSRRISDEVELSPVSSSKQSQ